MTSNAFVRPWRAARVSDWWAYKIPPLLAVGYAGLLLFAVPPRDWTTVLAALGAIVLVAIYGYALNDLADMESDRLSGRPNQMASIGLLGRTVMIAVPLLGLLSIGLWIGDAILGALLGLNVALPTAYSLPPVRLKGRGAWGVIADAAGVHMVPTTIVARAVTLGVDVTEWLPAVFVASAAGWAFASGLRGIVVHQVRDRSHDERAKVSTLVAALGADRSKQLVVRWLVPAELTCLAVFIGLMIPVSPVVTGVAILFAVLEWRRTRLGWILPQFDAPEESREPYQPLVNNEFYELWLPFGLAVELAARYPACWLIVIAQVVVFLPNIRTRLHDVSRTVRTLETSGAAAVPRVRARRAPSAPTVVIGATTWTVNGVNVFSSNLARGLAGSNWPAHVLLTEEGTDFIHTRERAMPRPDGVTFHTLPVNRTDGWGTHWGAMVRYLEETAPCVYIPNSDWRHSCVCPQLSNQVIVVGVVHSDDPLHYDHVKRLGGSWNTVVAVSAAVAERTLEVCPSVADRLVTIPIGVRIPASRPARERTSRLRLVYHGVLKQHQKRVLDLPRIVEAADALDVPVELTIVGAGPDEEALRAAAAPLVDRGLIRFSGVMSPDEAAALLETQDVYLLASEFEGLPNALVEAMGRGCVPVVSRMTSGIPELVRDGVNGFLAPMGEPDAFAEYLRLLWVDPARREAMSANAFQSVRDSRFRVEAMVDAYQELFRRAWADSRRRRFVRSSAPLSPPPRSVAGISLFPIELPHAEPGLGEFPSALEADGYRAQVRAIVPGDAPRRVVNRARTLAAREGVSLQDWKVFVAAPVWTANGVNWWSEDLVRGLRRAGMDARLLMTEEATDLVRIDEPRMRRPADLPVNSLAIEGADTWGARWGAMVQLLEQSAPCIYIPQFDWRHSCVAPVLSDDVIVVGGVHDAGDLYTEHARRLGEYWNAVVVTDAPLVGDVRRLMPPLNDRMVVIPHGIAHPAEALRKPEPIDGLPTLLVVTDENAPDGVGRLVDFTAALGGVWGIQSIAVDPSAPARERLVRSGARVVMHPNRQEWLEICEASHFVVVADPSPRACRLALDAMAYGCIPVLVEPYAEELAAGDGDGRIVARRGAWPETLRRLVELAGAPVERFRMSDEARRIARASGYQMDQMIEAALGLFRHVVAETHVGAFRRRRGPILPPPAHVGDTSVFPVSLRFACELGSFPTAGDAARFRAIARARHLGGVTP